MYVTQKMTFFYNNYAFQNANQTPPIKVNVYKQQIKMSKLHFRVEYHRPIGGKKKHKIAVSKSIPVMTKAILSNKMPWLHTSTNTYLSDCRFCSHPNYYYLVSVLHTDKQIYFLNEDVIWVVELTRTSYPKSSRNA